MPYQVIASSVPFRPDNGLNAFGDFDRLICMSYRNASNDGDVPAPNIIHRYFLSGEGHGRVIKELTGAEVATAFESYFWQSSTKMTLPDVEKIPDSPLVDTCLGVEG